MTSKQYLRQAYRLNERINSHIRELEQLKLISTSLPGIDFSQERVQGGNFFVATSVGDVDVYAFGGGGALLGGKNKTPTGVREGNNVFARKGHVLLYHTSGSGKSEIKSCSV